MPKPPSNSKSVRIARAQLPKASDNAYRAMRELGSVRDKSLRQQLIEWEKKRRMRSGETVKIYRGLVPSTDQDISKAFIGAGNYVTTDFDMAATYAGRKNRFATDERGKITGRILEMEVDSGDLLDMGKGRFIYAPKGFDIGQIRHGATNRLEGLGPTLRERLSNPLTSLGGLSRG